MAGERVRQDQGTYPEPASISGRLPWWLALIAVALLVCVPRPASAATRTWHGNVSGYWSTGDNWGGSSVPANGDDVVFPVSASRKTTTNDLPGLHLRSILFKGSNYAHYGNAVWLSDGITATNVSEVNRITCDLNLESTQAFRVARNGATLNIRGAVLLNGCNLSAEGEGTIYLRGAISGAGNVTMNGQGQLHLSGSVANSFVGVTRVHAGTLVLGKTAGVVAVPGELTVGRDGTAPATVRLDTHHQIAPGAAATVLAAGLLDLNGQSNTVGSLSFTNGGKVQTGAGCLELAGDVAVYGGEPAAAVISGNLNLGYTTRTFTVAENSQLTIEAGISGGYTGPLIWSGILKAGTGRLVLTGSSTYRGLTTIHEGSVVVSTNGTLGSVSGGTVVSSNAALILQQVRVGAEALTLSSATGVGGLFAYSSNQWDGNITLNTPVGIYTEGALTLSGVLSGPGGFTKTGPGTLQLSGTAANTYAGDTAVHEGLLQLGKSAATAIPAGKLTIGDGIGGSEADVVRELAANQIGDAVAVTINSSGLLDLYGWDDRIGPLVLNGGHVSTEQTASLIGLLTLGGDVTVNTNADAHSIIRGRAALPATRIFNIVGQLWPNDLEVRAALSGSGGITKTGDGFMLLAGSNSFSGVATVNAGLLSVSHPFALGATNGGTLINTQASLSILAGTQIRDETLTLNGLGLGGGAKVSSSQGSNGWIGSVTLNSTGPILVSEADGSLDLGDRITGSGALIKVGEGRLALTGRSHNSFTGGTTVREGVLALGKTNQAIAVPGSLVIGDGVGGAGADLVTVEGDLEIAAGAAVTVTNSGWLKLDGRQTTIGSLAGDGQVSVPSATFEVGSNNTSTVFSGLISGDASHLLKSGTGTLTLSGDNPCVGPLTIKAGTLAVNGTQPGSQVTVNAGATLSGTGTVGHLAVNGGVLSPGPGPGRLTCNNLVFTSNSTLRVELNGAQAGTGYDQVLIRGTNDLGGAALQVVTGFSPALGDSFRVLDNAGGDVIQGLFAGRPSGSTFYAGTAWFRIDYDSGTGNDVVLTVTQLPDPLLITGWNRVHTNLVLTWSGGTAPYSIEKKVALSNGAVWQVVGQTTNATNVTLPMNTPTGFLRVRGGN